MLHFRPDEIFFRFENNERNGDKVALTHFFFRVFKALMLNWIEYRARSPTATANPIWKGPWPRKFEAYIHSSERRETNSFFFSYLYYMLLLSREIYLVLTMGYDDDATSHSVCVLLIHTAWSIVKFTVLLHSKKSPYIN